MTSIPDGRLRPEPRLGLFQGPEPGGLRCLRGAGRL